MQNTAPAILCLALACLAPTALRAQTPGSVDATFNAAADFITFTPAVQPDGKILVCGSFSHLDKTPHVAIGRVNANGTIDADFKANTDDSVYAVAVQSDGNILLGGQFSTVNGVTGHGYIARLKPDGTLDTTFKAHAGITADDQGQGEITQVVIQPDKKILIAGHFDTVNGASHPNLARLNSDGTTDATFKSTGTSDDVVSMVLQPADDKILVGGDFSVIDDANINRLARLKPDGTLDPDFHTSNDLTGLAVAVQPDGKILAAGFNVARLKTDGTADPTFQTISTDNQINSILVQPNGKIIVGGQFTKVNSVAHPILARFKTDGTLDTGFNASFATPFSPYDLAIEKMALQPDGKIVLCGNFEQVGGATHLAVARLHGDPAAPTITSADTATATVGQPFSYQIEATGDPTRYGVAGLFSGIHVDQQTGLVSGTPTAPGTHTLTLQATNSAGTGTETLTLTVKTAPPVITSADAASSRVGTPFRYQITATNHPTRYGVIGLRAGLSVDTTTGLLSGTPTASGSFPMTLTAVNGAGKGTASLTVTISK